MGRDAERLANLRKAVASCGSNLSIVPLGSNCVDRVLNGGSRRGTLHEVYTGDASHEASATGFTLGFAARLAGNKPLFWIATDFATLEHGALNATGLAELGLNPARFVLVQLARGKDALRAAGDVLACASVGAAVLEMQGECKALDLNASRRLALCAAHHNVSIIVLRTGSEPQPSAAETRWLIHAATSPPPNEESDWGAPQFDVRLIRNRRGALGDWRLEWNCRNGLFIGTGDQRKETDTRRVAPAPAHRPAAAALRRAS